MEWKICTLLLQSTSMAIVDEATLLVSLEQHQQGRKWLLKTGWASSNAARRHYPAAPSILF